jgi:peptide/nickel transport system substrate-binding protein
MTERRKGRRGLAAVAALAAAGLLAAACSSSAPASSNASSTQSAPAGTPQHGGTLTTITPGAPSSLDPILGGSGGDQYSLYPIFDRLVNFTPDLKPIPGLATSWSYPSPATLVLNLRSGVKFQDGTPFNAAAVKFNLDRARTLKTSTVLPDLAPITAVDVTSPLQVTIHLSAPDTALPLILADRAGMMSSPAAVKKEGASYALHPVGTGPFEVSSYVPNASLKLVKNPHYWQAGKPYLNGIDISYITDGQTEVNSVVAGQTDFATTIAPNYVTTLKNNPAVVVSSAQSLGFDGCYFDFAHSPFNKLAARQAIQAALNPKAISNALYFGLGEAATQFFPKGYWAYEPSLATPLYNPAKAKQLARSAGLTGMTITGLGYEAANQSRKLQIIQSQLAAVGIKMNITIEEVGAAVQNFYIGHKFDIFCSGWSGRPDPSETFGSLIAASSFYNAGNYAPSNVNALIAAGQKSASTAARRAAYLPLAQLVKAQALWMPLVFDPAVNIYLPKVKGFTPNLYGKIDISFLWLAK